MFCKVTIVLSAIFLGFAHAANWALLIAGSNGFYNYRHQADVAHAYQILRNKGNFPASNIITMMYDDIANSPSNKKPGQLFNKPNGPDVYKGVQIDYKGNDVTAKNFLNVLGGNAEAVKGIGSGKVIASTEKDNVFVYYSDHGAFGFVGMPTPGYLYAHDLNTTLSQMAESKRFNKLVFYLEACESGSMFENVLPGNENVWAITAANTKESSYAFYYDNTLGTYLGDEFSVHWLEDADAEVLNANTFTIEKQFEIVKKAVVQSHVMKYGDSNMANLPVGEFLLFNKFAPLASTGKFRRSVSYAHSEPVDVREVEIEILKKQIEASHDEREIADLKALLEQEMSARSKIDDLFDKIVYIVTNRFKRVEHPYDSPRDFVCLKAAVEAFEASCGSLQGYGFKYGRTLAALCDLGYADEAIQNAIQQVCPATILLHEF